VALILVVAWAVFLTMQTGGAFAGVPRLLFPVIGQVHYQDDFGDARGQGAHEGNDIMAAWKSPAIAVEAGKVKIWTSSARAGCMLYLYGSSGTTYLYIHLNNDRTAKSEDSGGCKRGVAYAPGLKDGQHVRAGQLIAYVGDSGDAEGVGHHLHFELHPGDGAAVSPYRYLRRAEKLLFAVPEGQGARGAAADLVLTLAGKVVAYDPGTGSQDPEPPAGGSGGGGSSGGGQGGGTSVEPLPPPPPPPSRSSGDGGAGKGSLTVRVTRVQLSSGGSWRVTRQVVLAVTKDLVLERSSGKKVRLDDLANGVAVTVTTAPVDLSLQSQRARPGVLRAARVLIR
jgi:Peptidase family M23